MNVAVVSGITAFFSGRNYKPDSKETKAWRIFEDSFITTTCYAIARNSFPGPESLHDRASAFFTSCPFNVIISCVSAIVYVKIEDMIENEKKEMNKKSEDNQTNPPKESAPPAIEPPIANQPNEGVDYPKMHTSRLDKLADRLIDQWVE